jgi:hypothetical protein
MSARAKVRDAMAGARAVASIPPTGKGTVNKWGLPDDCPVVPLGKSGQNFFYLDAMQQLIALGAKDHSRLNLVSLFGAKVDYIHGKKPWNRYNKDGDWSGIRPEAIADDMMKACAHAGVWNPSGRERGRGAWLGDDGELILHCGDRVMIFDPRLPETWGLRQVLPPGVIGNHVYPAAERAGLPSEGDAPADAAETVLDVLQTWNWRRFDLDALLLLGWIGAAMIGGALHWRPMVWLTGGKNTGKSTLQNFMNGLMAGALIDLADASPAYVWQTLQRQTWPVKIDELEAEEDNRRQTAIIKLARLAASGGTLGRGSDKHVPVDFVLRSGFAFSSIQIPPLTAADRSRMAILELGPLTVGAPVPDMDRGRLRDLGAILRRRLINGWARLPETLELYRSALQRQGHNARGADQFGTLLACADLLLFDRVPGQHVEEITARLHADQVAETAENLPDEEQCWQHLLSSPLALYRNGEQASVGEWINRAAGRMPQWDDIGGARRALATFGIRIEKHAHRQVVAVANAHTALSGLFDRTRWTTPRGTGGQWVQALRRLDGAIASPGAYYFGGATGRATLVPFRFVPEPDLQPALPLEDLADE